MVTKKCVISSLFLTTAIMIPNSIARAGNDFRYSRRRESLRGQKNNFQSLQNEKDDYSSSFAVELSPASENYSLKKKKMASRKNFIGKKSTKKSKGRVSSAYSAVSVLKEDPYSSQQMETADGEGMPPTLVHTITPASAPLAATSWNVDLDLKWKTKMWQIQVAITIQPPQNHGASPIYHGYMFSYFLQTLRYLHVNVSLNPT